VDYAFDELGKAGYQVSSAYTMVKDRDRCRFVYRDGLCMGPTCSATGVASFGHVNGVHVTECRYLGSNTSHCSTRECCLWAGRCRCSRRELLIREMILQLKTGRLDPPTSAGKFGVDHPERFRDRLSISWPRPGNLTVDDDRSK